ncbi:MAG TPA: efflux RND transporter periplasmic adaptor subunit [Burkholderiales bacterium]|nr:efflux RND transporter periplasmic adaptor subunit [Burkholderiales bacterium]
MKSALLGIVTACIVCGCNSKAEVAPPPQPVAQGDHIVFPRDSKQLSALSSVAVEPEAGRAVAVPGRIAWDETRTSRVFSPVAGRIVEVRVKPGDAVRAGQTIALVSSPDFGQAQAEVRKAQADYALAEKNRARAAELYDAGVIALKDFQAAGADLERAQAERDRTLAREKLFGASQSVDQQFKLAAPIGGLVVESNVNPGQEVRPDQAQPGTPSLFVISDPSHLWVLIDVPENLAEAFRPGMTVRVRTPTWADAVFDAKIDHVAAFLDPVTHAVQARAGIDNRDRKLRAEMYVTAEATLARADTLRMPAAAALLIGDRYYAFVDEGAGRYVRRPLEVEEGGFGTLRVRKGLAAGDKVVTEGALLLQQILSARH